MRSVVEAAARRFGDRAAALEMGYIRFAEAHLAVDLQGDVAPAVALLARNGQASGELEHHQMQYWRWSLEWYCAYAEGDYARAETLMRQGLERATVLRNGFVPILATLQLADAVLAQGDAVEADQLYLDALQRGLALGAPLLSCLALLGRGRAAEQKGDYLRVLTFAGEAHQVVHLEGFLRLTPRICVVLGHAQAGLGRYAEAAESYATALADDTAFGHPARVVAGAVAVAAMRRAQGDVAGAIRLIEPQILLLLGGALTGMDEPIRTLLSAAETLRSAGDARVERLVERARAELARRAALVRPERRDAFLNAIPAHRAFQNNAEAVTS
jgi:tetratricopeptide (TPR) repeat protein